MKHDEPFLSISQFQSLISGIPGRLDQPGTPAFMAAEVFLRCATPVDLSDTEVPQLFRKYLGVNKTPHPTLLRALNVAKQMSIVCYRL